MERDLGPVEEQEQLVLAGMKTRQQAIEGDEPGPALEDALEAGAAEFVACGKGRLGML
jgi:hypothetical protein